VLVTRTPGSLAELPPAAVVGTSSLRRRVLALSRRPDLTITEIRGNVETRLGKLATGQYEALILAAAGLRRLGLQPAHAMAFTVEEFPPAVGQGILGLEAREGDRHTLELLYSVDDSRTRTAALAERALLLGLGADCLTPVAGHAVVEGDALTVTGLVASVDARTVVRATVSGPCDTAEELGAKLAQALLARGAGRLLARPDQAGAASHEF
jgi:hydroxymethylbilane synthase